MLSNAGYCVVQYVLGLGDRHPSNIMIKPNGNREWQPLRKQQRSSST